MAEKKNSETLPEEHSEVKPNIESKQAMPLDKPVDKDTSVVPVPTVMVPDTTRLSISSAKAPTMDLYKKLLPAVLFLLTFVTVMTMLLIYMDTVALEAQQFRLNMSQDYELERIPQESPALVQFVRMFHLGARAPAPPAPLEPTPTIKVLDQLYGEIYNGTFVEVVPVGGRLASTRYVESARGWSGVAARAAARDCLALRGPARALHACLSTTPHPREVTYHESDSHLSGFRSRVLCLPLYTVLLVGEATRATLAVLAGDAVLPALTHLPFDKVHLQVIEVISEDPVNISKITELLQSKNYTVAAQFEDRTMYALHDA